MSGDINPGNDILYVIADESVILVVANIM